MEMPLVANPPFEYTVSYSVNYQISLLNIAWSWDVMNSDLLTLQCKVHVWPEWIFCA